MLTFLENQLMTPSNRYETMATTFFRMAGENFITFARFLLSSRGGITRFVKNLDSNKSKPVDLFFICEELDIRDPESRPSYFAVCTYFIGAVEQTKKTFDEIPSCIASEVGQMRINQLYEKMSSMSFVQISMFERLGKVDSKVLKKTSNPFAQAYFFQDVSLFNNLDKAKSFISERLPLQKSRRQESNQPRFNASYQRKFSKMLYGTIIKSQIHISQKDSLTLEKVSSQLKKYEVAQESFMNDQSQEFEDVEYVEFDENLQIESQQQLQVLNFLKKTRLFSIRQIRERLRDAERASMRQQ